MPLISIEEALKSTYDYIVVGSGASGLILSQRLSEDPNVSVLVLEAGVVHEKDPAITRPGQQGLHLVNPKYDWSFQTIPQKHLGDRSVGWSRGKSLGGSTTIGFLGWSIPHAEDVNDWERLGNKGWNWETYRKYVNRDVYFTPRDKSADKVNKQVVEDWTHPFTDGDRHISFPKVLLDLELKFQETLVKLGVPRAQNPIDGDNLGVSFMPNTLDPRDNTRSYAGGIYLAKYASRPNLSVLTEAYVTRVILEKGNNGDHITTGVEFYYKDEEEVKSARASKEIILSAGAVKTPQILEFSGIGLPDVLSKINVPLQVDLPVGENVQEHIWTTMTFELKDDTTETFDLLREEGQIEKHAKLYEQSKGLFNAGFTNFVYQPLDAISPRAKEIRADAISTIREKIKAGKYSLGAATTLEAQLKKIERGAVDCELMNLPAFLSAPNPPQPGKKHVSICCISNQPWSRGTIHSSSSDPRAAPEFDPRYFEDSADLELLVELVKFARKIPSTAPFKDLFNDPIVEVNPGSAVQTDDQIRDWIKQTVGSTWHTIGSASMLPKEKGGVVDTSLKVYGTTNLRVADLSIVPLHISAHTQATAYMVGEYAADIIKGVTTV